MSENTQMSATPFVTEVGLITPPASAGGVFSSTSTVGGAPADTILGQMEQADTTAETIAEEAKAMKLTRLEGEAFEWIARGYEANVQLGRVLTQIKALVKRGEWVPYYEATFAPKGVPLRTAQHYMKLACDEDANVMENANSAFLPATDTGATAIQQAVAVAKEAVAAAPTPQPQSKPKKQRKPRLRLDGNYSLELWLSAERKDNLDALRESQNWVAAQRILIATLDRLFVQFGLVNPPMPKEVESKPLTTEQTEARISLTRKKLTMWKDAENVPAYEATDDDLPLSLRETDQVEQEPEYEHALA